MLKLALTQSGAGGDYNNEKLEFVGDRVLGLAVANMLYKMFPTETEGELARRYSVLVSAETLASVAKKLGLESEIRHGHITCGRVNNILADAMEALCGAIFLDGGFDTVQKIITDIWHDLAAAEKVAPKDPKTTLQEFVQKVASGALPKYEYLEVIGAPHNPEFHVRVTALGKSAEGKGGSKKAASADAAAALLKMLAI